MVREADPVDGEPFGVRAEPVGYTVTVDDRNEELHLIGPDEIAYRLELTPAQLKITWTALKSLLDDYGHDERDMQDLVREVLDKLPDEHSIAAIDVRRAHR